VIERDLDNENLDIPQIAHALNLSRAQLHRKITALTGKSASAFVRTVRLEASKRFLTDPEMNIAQVAFSVGFKYAENFSRAFSDEYGVSPSVWREKADGG
jgi:transcriptional regulator GlxA family with amidase domain